MKKIFPEKYSPRLDFFATQKAIKLVKDSFENHLAENLNLVRVSAPRFVRPSTGLQDDLAGTQQPVSFASKFEDGIEIVHSLAKWKRHTLGKRGFEVGTGLYTDMDAIRKDEDVDEIHSLYVDQWDWEKVISKEDRSVEYLKKTVRKIYSAILDTAKVLKEEYPELSISIPGHIDFIHSEELEKTYPHLTPGQRENMVAKELGAVFIIGIGHPLKSGNPHDVRAADYDDWSTVTSPDTKGLNGDIIVWDKIRGRALELSSMGVRVDKHSLTHQLKAMDLTHRKKLDFHKGILEEKTPLTIGGGIGQSRICMWLLEKAHIGEVQSSLWPKEVEEEFDKKGIALL